jgi:RNA 2',3'-cyclic 3'-phosphodiesterase
MHRLFVAILPPAAIRAQLRSIMGGVAGARWQRDDQLHLTLRFIGQADRRSLEDIAATLDATRFPPFEISLRGIGTFDRKGVVESLWAGVADGQSLAMLHRKIDRALVCAGIDSEGRAYKPHITLARFGRNGGDVGAFLAAHEGMTLAAFPVTAFHLFESRLHADGGEHEIVASYPIGSRALPSA